MTFNIKEEEMQYKIVKIWKFIKFRAMDNFHMTIPLRLILPWLIKLSGYLRCLEHKSLFF